MKWKIKFQQTVSFERIIENINTNIKFQQTVSFESILEIINTNLLHFSISHFALEIFSLNWYPNEWPYDVYSVQTAFVNFINLGAITHCIGNTVLCNDV